MPSPLSRHPNTDPAHYVVDSIGEARLADAMREEIAKIPMYRDLLDTPTWVEVSDHTDVHAVLSASRC